MDLTESAEYLRHHLALVGRTDPLFADDAIARLHKASLGLPRLLNNGATAALIAATTAGKALVDDDWMLLCQETKAGRSGWDRSMGVWSVSSRL